MATKYNWRNRKLIAGGWIFPLAIVTGFVSTAIVRAVAIRTNFVAKPNPIIPQHVHDVAYMGGIGVALGILGALLIWNIGAAGTPDHTWFNLYAIPGIAFLLLGAIDDLHPLSPSIKLLWQIIIAGFCAWSGIHLELTGWLLADLFLTTGWIVVVINAVNLTDVCDGLVGGLALIGFITIAALAPDLALPALAGAGACAGFLVWNAPPARIFLGDAGSHLLGFLLSAFGIQAISTDPWCNWPIMLLIAGVPLFELALLIIIRLKKGIPWWQGSPDHFSLRLQAAGLSRWETDLCAWVSAIAMAGLALLWKHLDPVINWILLSLILAFLIAAGMQIARWEVSARPSSRPR
ncbi:MAG: MraY family glycosyltransferase [Gammaproteobacteria bacterium]|nr:MraY family glycosyltransferase [Gammaproteobacteria bacterium]